ncbi:MAG: GreA/GreB family elongation factor [Campylobacterales bacterium]|nr:GreA/GreB family elongation factor [Campylobacterales bacterium]
MKFQIVGTHEIELEPKLSISNISPMGKIILGLELYDEFEVNGNNYELISFN